MELYLPCRQTIPALLLTCTCIVVKLYLCNHQAVPAFSTNSARIVHCDGKKVNILHAVSEGFVGSVLLRNNCQVVPALSSNHACTIINLYLHRRLAVPAPSSSSPCFSSSCACIVLCDGQKVNIRHAVSQSFVASLLVRHCHQVVPALS